MKRVIGMGIARILGKGGRHALRVYNSSQPPAKKALSLAPFSSIFQVDQQGMRAITGLGANRFRLGNDLDCSIPDSRVDGIIEWFYRRSGRETLMLPKLLDVLVGLKVLSNSDRQGNSEEFLYSLSYSTDVVLEGPTIYLIDLIRVRLAPAERLRRKGHLYFATQDELRAHRTAQGHPITSLAGAVFL